MTTRPSMLRAGATGALLLCSCAGGAARRDSAPSAAAPEQITRTGPEQIVWVEGGAGRLRVSDGGTGGVPVVFVHGLGGDLEAWRAQLEHLRPVRRAIAYDQRGHGESDRARDGVYTIAALTEDLDRVVRALRLERFYLVGHSLAGAVLTQYAGAHPEKVAGLVYVDAIGDFSRVPRQQVQSMLVREATPKFGRPQQRETFSQILGSAARPATRQRVLASLDRLDPPAFVALRRSMAEFSGAEPLSRYQGPRASIEVAGYEFPVLFSALDPSAPKATIPGVSHWLMMDDPEAFDRALDPLLGIDTAAKGH